MLRRSVGSIEFDWNLETTEMSEKRGTDNAPFKLTLSTTERRYGERGNTPLLIALLKILQPSHNIGQARNRTPVILCWEIQNPGGHELAKKIRSPEADLFGGTPRHVILIHIWETLLELQRDAFPHNTHTVHCVDEGLHLGCKQIAN